METKNLEHHIITLLEGMINDRFNGLQIDKVLDGRAYHKSCDEILNLELGYESITHHFHIVNLNYSLEDKYSMVGVN